MARAAVNSLLGGVSGTLSGLTFVQTGRGTVVRAASEKRRASTPAMKEAQARMRLASMAFGRLTREEAVAWDRYALTLAAPDPKTGLMVAPSGQQAHNGLATRLLQMDPKAELPRVPPVGVFPGDGVRVSASATLDGIVLTADVPNHPGVVTELLVQPLLRANRRTYLKRYRTAAFVAFAPGTMIHDLPKNGPTALAYRFVEFATGRTTAIIEIGVVV